MSKFIIYALVDPRNDQPFYVGFTSRGDIRIKEHISEATGSRSDINLGKRATILDILSEGLIPSSTILFESETEGESLTKEREWILHYGRLDNGTGILTNRCDGGQGATNHNISEEGRQRLSERLKGKTYAEIHGVEKASRLREHYSQMLSGEGNPMYGRNHTIESRAKMSNSRKGLIRDYVYTEEHRNKIRHSNRSRGVSEETRGKISKAAKEGKYNKQPRSDDFKARVSATKLKKSAEKKAQAPKYNWIHDQHGRITASRYELLELYSGLTVGELGHVIRGKYRQHKGWRLDQ